MDNWLLKRMMVTKQRQQLARTTKEVVIELKSSEKTHSPSILAESVAIMLAPHTYTQLIYIECRAHTAG